MKAFTKVLCVILAVAMLLGLCACGKKFVNRRAVAIGSARSLRLGKKGKEGA